MKLVSLVLLLAVGINLSSSVELDPEEDALEESTTLRLIAGIPYGSISGRVAEYFATQRTRTIKPLLQKQQLENSI